MQKKILWLLGIFFICQSICAQSPELKASFNNILTILKEYNVETPEVSGSRSGEPSLAVKNYNLSFSYPYITISYNIVYAPNRTGYDKEKIGKRIIKFSIIDTKILKSNINYYYGTPLWFFSESGIEKTASGKKDLLTHWELTASTLVCQKLEQEFNYFKNLIKNTGFTGSIGRGQTNNSTSSGNSNKTVIKLKKEHSGIYTVPCKVNGLSLKFIFDTGASSVSISKSEAIFMLKNGYLSKNDIIGSQQFQTASGDILEGTRIIIRKIEVGGLVLRNVEASVVHSDNAPLLLGQSVLSRLGKIQIDYNSSTLTIIR